jgi:hypothetical protein
MRIPLQSLADGGLAAAGTVLTIVLDAFLLRVFWSHFRDAFAFRVYRPAYSRSGRRNRVRF